MVILTRSNEDNRLLEEKIISSNVNLDTLKIDVISFNTIKNNILVDRSIIVTSSVAASFLVGRIYSKTIASVVGAKTASILSRNREVEILRVYQSVKEMVKSMDRNLLAISTYYSGNVISMEIPLCKRIIVYYVSYLEDFDKYTCGLIRSSSVRYIMLYSANVATTISKIIAKNKLAHCFYDTVALGLSDHILDCFSFCRSRIAVGSEDNMIDMLKHKT